MEPAEVGTPSTVMMKILDAADALVSAVYHAGWAAEAAGPAEVEVYARVRDRALTLAKEAVALFAEVEALK